MSAEHAELLRTLQALEQELHHPGVRCSAARLEQLLHADFHEVGRSGRRYTRAMVIAHLLAELTPAHIVSTAFALTPLGAGHALLTYQSTPTATDGSPTDPTHRASVWMCGEGGLWQMLYHQGTPAHAPDA